VSVRVLLLEGSPVEALAIQRELSPRHEVRPVPSLAEALRLLVDSAWWPEVVIADVRLQDREGLALFEQVQRAARGTPILVSTGQTAGSLCRQVDALASIGTGVNDHDDLLKLLLQQQRLVQHTVTMTRADIVSELDRMARQAADDAASRAAEELLQRLGIQDGEGLRMAIRLARGWDAAKSRFISAVSTGIASALLLALGAGIVAMLERGTR
jgi:CheY-like chemotaxis protein